MSQLESEIFAMKHNWRLCFISRVYPFLNSISTGQQTNQPTNQLTFMKGTSKTNQRHSK